jgi:hypothetical protein
MNDVYVVILTSEIDTKVLCVFSNCEDAERFVFKEWANYVASGSNTALLCVDLEYRVIVVNNGVATMTSQVFDILRREFNP